MNLEHAWSQSRWKHNPAAIVLRRRRGIILRGWREEVGLSVEQVAKALGLDSTKVLVALEEGLGDLGRERVFRLARIYGVEHALMLRVIRTGSVGPQA